MHDYQENSGDTKSFLGFCFCYFFLAYLLAASSELAGVYGVSPAPLGRERGE